MHFRHFLRPTLLALALSLGVAVAQTPAPSRVAVVDVNRVLTTSRAGKAAYEKLAKMQTERVARAKALDDEVKKLDGEINARRPALPADKLAELQRQLADKRLAMQRFAQDADREIKEARDRELQSLEARVKPVIDRVAREGGWTAIFNKFESGLIFISDASDITDAVIKHFDEAQPVGK